MKKTFLLALTLPLLFISSLFANAPSYYALPESGYLSNVVIDIIEHNGGVWFATSEGLNYTTDDGQTWYYYDDSNGLPSSSISALFSVPTATGTRIWAATNHVEFIDEFNYNISDGISYSDDDGATWTQVNFGADGLNIPYIWGGDRTIYDITGHYNPSNPEFDNWLFFSAFAGGFLASKDGGENWKRIFPSRVDSVQYNSSSVPSLQNRNFSCAADTSRPDTFMVWTGTASGFYSYMYLAPKDKPYSKYINDAIVCDSCGGTDGSYIYLAGEKCITRGSASGTTFFSRFTDQGLAGNKVLSVYDFGGRIFAGCVDEDVIHVGLSVSEDGGESWNEINVPGISDLSSMNNYIYQFEEMNGRLYMAAELAGLFVSSDTGDTWQHIYVDSSDTTINNQRNTVYSLLATGDTLIVGTDSGLVHLFMDPSGNIDSTRFKVFDATRGYANRIMKIKKHDFDGVEVLWTVQQINSVDGTPIVGRSSDGGLTFTPLQVNAMTYDIDFIGDTTFVVGNEGIRFTPDSANPGLSTDWIYSVEEFSGTALIDSLGADTVTAMDVKGDTILFGTNNGFALSLDRGETYNIIRINTDTLTPDQVINYTSDIYGISGDWVPAIDVQYLDSEPFAWIWASTRPVYSGSSSISVGVPTRYNVVDTLTGDTIDFFYQHIWYPVLDGFAWNFDFANDTVFAATNEGLLYGQVDSLIADSTAWDTLTFEDENGVSLLMPDVPVYAVKVTDDYVWVGTDDRTILVDRSDFGNQSAIFVVDEDSPDDEVYAFPVPFSHVNSRGIDFHFVANQNTTVTIEVYDFDMSLVKRVVDNASVEAGIYPQSGNDRFNWDGKNGRGDEVAVGVYYFKVELGTGDVRWGKLAVIP